MTKYVIRNKGDKNVFFGPPGYGIVKGIGNAHRYESDPRTSPEYMYELVEVETTPAEQVDELKGRLKIAECGRVLAEEIALARVRQNADLLAANSKLLGRARAAEAMSNGAGARIAQLNEALGEARARAERAERAIGESEAARRQALDLSRDAIADFKSLKKTLSEVTDGRRFRDRTPESGRPAVAAIAPQPWDRGDYFKGLGMRS